MYILCVCVGLPAPLPAWPSRLRAGCSKPRRRCPGCDQSGLSLAPRFTAPLLAPPRLEASLLSPGQPDRLDHGARPLPAAALPSIPDYLGATSTPAPGKGSKTVRFWRGVTPTPLHPKTLVFPEQPPGRRAARGTRVLLGRCRDPTTRGTGAQAPQREPQPVWRCGLARSRPRLGSMKCGGSGPYNERKLSEHLDLLEMAPI